MTLSEQRLAMAKNLPFHPVVFVELILSLAKQSEQHPDRPILKSMVQEDRIFFHQALHLICQNAETALSESQVTNYDKR